MEEARIELPPHRKVLAADAQDTDTLSQLKNERQVPIYLPKDPEKDEYVLKDGKLGWIRMVSINGVSWFIELDKSTTVPETIYNLVMQSERAQQYADALIEAEKNRHVIL